jgi:hypothetical protein
LGVWGKSEIPPTHFLFLFCEKKENTSPHVNVKNKKILSQNTINHILNKNTYPKNNLKNRRKPPNKNTLKLKKRNFSQKNDLEARRVASHKKAILKIKSYYKLHKRK